MLETKYSKKELELFRAFNVSPNIIKELHHWEIHNLLMHRCFLNNLKGPHVDSLRRCMKALDGNGPYRMTKEYDELIQLK